MGKVLRIPSQWFNKPSGTKSLSLTHVFQWHARFETGRTSVDDDEHTRRPTTCTDPETVARIQQLFCQDRRQTIHDIAEEVGIGYGHANGLWRKKWTGTVSQPNLCPGSWQLTRSSSVSTSAILCFARNTKWLSSPPTVLHWLDTLWLLPNIFQKRNRSWREASLMLLRRSRPNRRESLTLWQKITSRKRSKNGVDGGIGVYMRNGTTSRVMAVSWPYSEFYNFYSVSPKYFGFHHVHEDLSRFYSCRRHAFAKTCTFTQRSIVIYCYQWHVAKQYIEK
jgi:hypothetical protein